MHKLQRKKCDSRKNIYFEIYKALFALKVKVKTILCKDKHHCLFQLKRFITMKRLLFTLSGQRGFNSKFSMSHFFQSRFFSVIRDPIISPYRLMRKTSSNSLPRMLRHSSCFVGKWDYLLCTDIYTVIASM